MKTASCAVIRNLSFKYRTSDTLSLNKLNLNIPHKSCTLLLGPNGAGKSTLMSLLCGLLPMQSGEISFPLFSAKNFFSYGTQNCALYSELTLEENLVLFSRLMGVQDIQNIQALIQEMGLESFKHKKINACSGGIKQRAHIAISLLGKHPFLILDEPFNNVDPESRALITESLKNYMARNNATVLLSSHQFEAMEDIWTHLAFIQKGEISEFLERDTLKNKESLNHLFFKLKEARVSHG